MATLIIVDDSPTTRHVLKGIVEGAGHEVLAQCDNGLEALTRSQELKPDVLLLDMLLPQLDGIGVLTRLQTTPYRPKVIMLSSVTAIEKIKQAKEAGLNYFVLKPFEESKVLETLQRCLDGDKR